jgi:hypothetical protein
MVSIGSVIVFSFTSADALGVWTYLVFGKLGTLMPFEKSFLEYRLKWDIAFVVYSGMQFFQ